MNDINVGLEGVLVGRTSISNVDGEQGRLSYRGEDIASLIARPFLQVIWLLLFGDYPSVQQEQQLAQFLLAHRDLGRDECTMLAALPLDTHPMLMLQALVPVLDCVQILQLEHGYNAGTFAGRVTLSTQAPIQSSIAASIGTLFGSLHGGAGICAIGGAARARRWLCG